MKAKYEVKDILAEAKKVFGLITYDYATDTDSDSRIIRNIQRYTKNNMTPISSHGRTKYYSREQVEQILYSDKGLHKYFLALAKEGAVKEFEISLKSNREYQYQINESLDESTLAFENRLAGLNLDLSDYFLLMEDATTEHEYLTLDELELLDKKGLFLRTNLSETEKETLAVKEEMTLLQSKQKAAIKESFQNKKLEIMITALFSREFELDEKLFLSDLINEYEAAELASPEPEMLRSIDRLKDFRYYCKAIKKEDEAFEE